jgi:AcrR family transcriptional regulator
MLVARTTAPHGANRANLIQAAFTVLSERGYEATTIKTVAQAAGVAPGLIHYYFASKQELLIAVVEDAAERYASEMAGVRAALSPAQALTAAAEARKERVEHEPDRERLRFELLALALRHPSLRPAAARVLSTGREGITRLFASVTGSDVTGDTSDTSDGMPAVFLAILDGVALQRLVDPDFDLDAAYQAIERLAQRILVERPDA